MRWTSRANTGPARLRRTKPLRAPKRPIRQSERHERPTGLNQRPSETGRAVVCCEARRVSQARTQAECSSCRCKQWTQKANRRATRRLTSFASTRRARPSRTTSATMSGMPMPPAVPPNAAHAIGEQRIRPSIRLTDLVRAHEVQSRLFLTAAGPRFTDEFSAEEKRPNRLSTQNMRPPANTNRSGLFLPDGTGGMLSAILGSGRGTAGVAGTAGADDFNQHVGGRRNFRDIRSRRQDGVRISWLGRVEPQRF